MPRLPRYARNDNTVCHCEARSNLCQPYAPYQATKPTQPAKRIFVSFARTGSAGASPSRDAPSRYFALRPRVFWEAPVLDEAIVGVHEESVFAHEHFVRFQECAGLFV